MLIKNMDCSNQVGENGYDMRVFVYHEVYKGQELGLLQKFYYKHINPSTNAVYLIREKLDLSCHNIYHMF
jgi:hypothetical protein